MTESVQADSDGGRGDRAHRSLPATGYAVKITLGGRVQGVGYRPFVYRLAKEHSVTGHVRNRLGEVDVVACGRPGVLTQFRKELIERAPPLSRPEVVKLLPVDTEPFEDFRIVASRLDAEARVYVPADYFMCEDCDRELHDRDDRRYRYPFINCTQCGPRYTLIEALPYDRANTTMAGFPLCPACEAEYHDPGDRRFHAEPVSCPECGPTLTLETVDGVRDDVHDHDTDALLADTVRRLRDGRIVAVKGVGGYHLMCDAGRADAVEVLRRRKRRAEKPLAVMIPVEGADGLDRVRSCVDLHGNEAAALKSPQRPIVLATKRPDSEVADNVAPGLDELGVFLPYSPLHQLLLEQFGGPLVATSGNLSGEPVMTDNVETSRRLAGVADAFLHHDRPIVRPADDSVYRRIGPSVRPVRLGRGAAPRELQLPYRQEQPLLAVGGQMKGTVALAWDNRVVVSPHIGEMDTARSLDVFEQVVASLQALYAVRAERVVCDAHPRYATHRWANRQSLPVETVWHHHAHASALAGERALPGYWLTFVWDGVGLGDDGTLWGGEAFHGKPGHWRRVASLKTFRLPGGDRAALEPWRSAAALHWECGRSWSDCPDAGGFARSAWDRDVNCPRTSAAGRLFDAAAALILGRTHTSFDAQGPMYLESLCRTRREPVYTSLHRGPDGLWCSDWTPLLDLMTDAARSARFRAETFHSSMALALLQQARRVRDEYPVEQVGLTGGVFQNRFLTEHVVDLLVRNGFRVCLPRRLPCNDAALSYGQAVDVAARR